MTWSCHKKKTASNQFYTVIFKNYKMKKLKKILFSFLGLILVLFLVFNFILSPVFAQKLKVYKGSNEFAWNGFAPIKDKKTIFIVADNNGTEMFDLMAPFYLFNVTEKANVYIVSEKKTPILLVNTLFILPHYTFFEIDSLKISPDVVVIPNVTVKLSEPPKQSIVNWIRSQVRANTIVLSICDGSATAAATGLYDGKPLTTHATDFKKLVKQFPNPKWIKDVSVTESGNLYSTAGVANATEGSLVVIKRLFGAETLQQVIKDIRYPDSSIQTAHKSEVVGTGTVIRIISKVLFQKNEKIGAWLTNGINEFELAGFLDTHSRTFPTSFNTFSKNGAAVRSKFGLTLFPTGDIIADKVKEIHFLDPTSITQVDQTSFPKAVFVSYEALPKWYPLNFYLQRIGDQYGNGFKRCVSVTLDYNL